MHYKDMLLTGSLAALVACGSACGRDSNTASRSSHAPRVFAPSQKQLLITNALPEAPRGTYATDWNIKSNALAQVSSTNETYNLESIVSDGKRFYVANNTEKATNELSFLLLKAADTTLVVNDDFNTVKYETDTYFIPTLLTNSEGRKARKVTLAVSGPYALKANRKDFSLGIDALDYAIANTSNKEISYTLKTFRINNEDFYAPFTNTNICDASPNFRLIPVKGTAREIAPSGQIALNSQKGIYVLNPVSHTDYAQRTSERLKSETAAQQLNAQHTNSYSPSRGMILQTYDTNTNMLDITTLKEEPEIAPVRD